MPFPPPKKKKKEKICPSWIFLLQEVHSGVKIGKKEIIVKWFFQLPRKKLSQDKANITKNLCRDHQMKV